jgi:hypothetical protein
MRAAVRYGVIDSAMKLSMLGFGNPVRIVCVYTVAPTAAGTFGIVAGTGFARRFHRIGRRAGDGVGDRGEHGRDRGGRHGGAHVGGDDAPRRHFARAME